MKHAWIAAARFLGIGWIIGGSLAGGFFGGMWLGRKLDMNEAFFGLLGMMLGLSIGVYIIYSGYTLLNKGQGNGNNEEN